MPSANIGAQRALFEAVHGTAPDIAGQQRANPTAVLLSAIWMLRYLDEDETAGLILAALKLVLAEGRVLTRDLGGTASTAAFADEISRTIDATPPPQ